MEEQQIINIFSESKNLIDLYEQIVQDWFHVAAGYHRILFTLWTKLFFRRNQGTSCFNGTW
jgi:hypothetical protein